MMANCFQLSYCEEKDFSQFVKGYFRKNVTVDGGRGWKTILN